jgi:hypothetical protein
MKVPSELLTYLHHEKNVPVEQLQVLLDMPFEDLMLRFKEVGVNVRFSEAEVRVPKWAYEKKKMPKRAKTNFNSKEWLSEAFKERGLTYIEAAKEAHVSTATLSRWTKKYKIFKGRKSTKARIKTLRINKKNSSKLSDLQVTH